MSNRLISVRLDPRLLTRQNILPTHHSFLSVPRSRLPCQTWMKRNRIGFKECVALDSCCVQRLEDGLIGRGLVRICPPLNCIVGYQRRTWGSCESVFLGYSRSVLSIKWVPTGLKRQGIWVNKSKILSGNRWCGGTSSTRSLARILWLRSDSAKVHACTVHQRSKGWQLKRVISLGPIFNTVWVGWAPLLWLRKRRQQVPESWSYSDRNIRNHISQENDILLFGGPA